MEEINVIFLFLKALTWRGALALLDVATHPTYTLPINLIAAIKSRRIPNIGEVVGSITRRVVKRLIHETIRSERDKLRPKRKRAWSRTKTRNPIRHHVERLVSEASFKHILNLAVKAAKRTAKRLGPPWTPKQGRRGRPPTYDPTLQAAALLVKHCYIKVGFQLGFRGLAEKLRRVGFDARLRGRRGPPTPSPETLYRAFSLTPAGWMDEAVAQLDRIASQRYARRFGLDGLNVFALDSTGLGLDRLVVAKRVLKSVLAHETIYVAAATRLLTNTIIAVDSGRDGIRDAKPFIQRLPPGGVLIADSEFDSETNHALAAEHSIQLICMPVRHTERVGGWYRRRAAEAFNPSTYRTRKLTERVFGNLSSRRVEPLTYRLPETRAKAVRLIASGHNLRCILTIEALSKLFRPI